MPRRHPRRASPPRRGRTARARRGIAEPSAIVQHSRRYINCSGIRWNGVSWRRAREKERARKSARERAREKERARKSARERAREKERARKGAREKARQKRRLRRSG